MPHVVWKSARSRATSLRWISGLKSALLLPKSSYAIIDYACIPYSTCIVLTQIAAAGLRHVTLTIFVNRLRQRWGWILKGPETLELVFHQATRHRVSFQTILLRSRARLGTSSCSVTVARRGVVRFLEILKNVSLSFCIYFFIITTIRNVSNLFVINFDM